MPRKIRQLIADLEQAGFRPVQGGKAGDDAHPYQEKQVRLAIHTATQ